MNSAANIEFVYLILLGITNFMENQSKGDDNRNSKIKEEINFGNKLKISKDKSTTKVTLCGVKFDNPEKWNILRRSDDSILNTI